ncbi:glycosyltransferase family 4 protein [Rubeoparvulum massiliense]|uniref:glycosyltransferase family 4 protein n=1 Tax=Rubeoparvulum massiliense TaxID=1631346 RepID=UPI00065DEA50|nr:glycosyltransferase family 4 protein [Rubeoparvulum massiliense]
MPPQLCFITPGTFAIPSPIYSSVESSLLQLTPLLSKHYDLHIIGRKRPGIPSQYGHFGTKIYNLPGNNLRLYVKHCVDWCEKNPYSIIQIENRPTYVPAFKQRLPSTPIILSLHSITFLQGKRRRLTAIYQGLEMADAILVNSDFLRQYLLRFARHEREAKRWEQKIQVRYFGIDLQSFLPLETPSVHQIRQHIRSQYGLEDLPVLLFCGRIQYYKGLHLLLQAAHRLEELGYRFALLIVGGSHYGRNLNTSYVQQVRTLRQQLKQPSFFIPFIPHQQVPHYYQLADLLIVPSIGPEAFGLVNLEGMATSLPIVTFQRGGIPEVVQHQRTGLLLPGISPVDELVKGIQTLLDQPNLARQLGLAGRKMVEEKFSWEHRAASLVPFYQQFLHSLEKG